MYSSTGRFVDVALAPSILCLRPLEHYFRAAQRNGAKIEPAIFT